MNNFPPGFGREMPTRDGAVYECKRANSIYIRQWGGGMFGTESPLSGFYPNELDCWRLLVPAEKVEKAYREGWNSGWLAKSEAVPIDEAPSKINEDFANSHARRVAKGEVV